MTAGAKVLLSGGEAEALQPRLELSGYQPITIRDLACESSGTRWPAALILSPDQEADIPQLRQRFPGVPLLLGIGSDSVAGRVRCLASGADDYWLTTAGASDLLTRLRLHLTLRPEEQPTPAPIPSCFQVADLVVIPASRHVERGGRAVALTARELDLLLLLLQERGQVVSRERILAEIWQGEGSAASNVIEVYVRYLRQKLEQGGERRLIHTVRGQGYCLEERLPARPQQGKGG